MSNPYVSSIITKYGDIENVPTDIKTLNEIQSRQGSTLLIDSLAESVATTANKFKLTALERETLIENLVLELQDALRERI